MGKVFKGVNAFYAEFDISGEGNSFEPAMQQEVLESRPFNSNYVRKDAGLRNDGGSLTGQLALADPGSAFFSNLGTKVPASFCLDGAAAAELDTCIFFNAISGKVDAPAVQGQLRNFTLQLAGDQPAIWGNVLAVGQKTASGNSAAGQSLAAVAAGQSIWAVVHCSVATSGTIDIEIESAATGDSGFASPTTRLTFTQIATTATYEVVTAKSAAGITDTLWRAKWTSASSPDHTIMVAFGIG